MNVNKRFRSSLNFKHILTIDISVIIILLTMFLFDKEISSLNDYSRFLNSRDYTYSVLIDKQLNTDTYAFYGRKVIFSKFESLNQSINCEVLMNDESSQTTSDFFNGYNVNTLNLNEVAVSKNTADKYHISEGDFLYSKNKYTNTIIRYTVKKILPNIYGLSSNDSSMEKGIILIGYDPDFIENIHTNYIYFYNEDHSLIYSSGASIVGNLNSISDIKNAIFMRYIYYVILTLAIEFVVCIGVFSLLIKFNVQIYRLKKQYGLNNLYKFIRIDEIIYSLCILLSVIIIYLIGSIFVGIVLEELLIFIFVLILTSLSCYEICAKKIRR